MQIFYLGKISKDDFVRVLFLNIPKHQRWVSIFGTGLYIFSFIFLFFTRRDQLFSYVSPFAYAFPLIFLSYALWVPYLQARSYDQPGNIYQNNVSGLINAEKITIQGGSVQASFLWNVFIEYKTEKDLLVLYQGAYIFNIFKKSMFQSNNEWEAFLALTKEKIVSNKKRRQAIK